MLIRFTTSLLVVFTIASTIVACNWKGEYELPNGVVVESNGLAPEQIYIYIQEDTITRTIFNYAEKVNIEFFNVEGFNRKNNLFYVGMSLTIVQGLDTVQHKPDIFPDDNHGVDLNQLDLINYFRAFFPYHENRDYEIHIRVWDKNGDGTFSFEMPFKIRTNPLIQVTEGGIQYKTIFFFDEITEESKNNNVFYQKSDIILFYEELSGFDVVDGKIYPSMSIIISDSLGHKLIDDKNIFAPFSDSGITPEEFEYIFPLQFYMSDGLTLSKAVLKTRLVDLKSTKFLEIETEIEIMPPKVIEKKKEGVNSLENGA